jgi:hypothetical protein
VTGGNREANAQAELRRAEGLVDKLATDGPRERAGGTRDGEQVVLRGDVFANGRDHVGDDSSESLQQLVERHRRFHEIRCLITE